MILPATHTLPRACSPLSDFSGFPAPLARPAGICAGKNEKSGGRVRVYTRALAHVCTYIYKRKGVFLPIFGADGLKTFVQGQLLTHLENINSITCNIPPKREGGGGEQCGQLGLLGLDYFASFVKL